MEVEAAPPSAADSGGRLDIDAIRSQVKAHLENRRDENELLFAASSGELLQDCILHVERASNAINEGFPKLLDLGIEDLEACVEHVKKEISAVDEENAKIDNEIDALCKTALQESLQVENELRSSYAKLEDVEAQAFWKSRSDTIQSQECSEAENIAYNFEIKKLHKLIEKNRSILSTLQDLHDVHQSEAALEFVEEMFSDVKVIAYKGNWIRFLVKTYIPTSEGRLCQQVLECASEPHVAEHELLIEFADETSELKNVKIYPDDVYIGEVVESAKSLRFSLFPLSLSTMKSPMEWLVRKIQYRIFLCALRNYVVKVSNKSRHIFEYIDRDETITVHLVERVDALIKISGSWPASSSNLKLVSLMNSDFPSVGIPVNTLCRVQEQANSLTEETRQNLVNFVNAIEEILVQQNYSQP